MEKIESVKQLDELGIKICEMLQVGIDKANVILPETFQQHRMLLYWKKSAN